MRSKSHPPETVLERLTSHGLSRRNAPDAAWCAAHLAMLCQSALDAYKTFGVFEAGERVGEPRGLFINYEGLPASIPKILLKHFDVEVSNNWVSAIKEESAFYSKGRGKEKGFTGDSEEKEEEASEATKEWAEKILQPLYEELEALGTKVALHVHPEVEALPVTTEGMKDWKQLEFPKVC